MVNLTINGENYKAFDTWAEMPLSKAVELAKLCNEMPTSLKSLYDLYAKSTPDNADLIQQEIKVLIGSQPDEEYIKNQPMFYGKVIKCLSDIPQEVIDKITSGHRIAFYQNYCFKFVFGVLYNPTDIEYKGIESFVHKGITYHLPKSKKVLGELRPFADRTSIEFAEATDLELFSKQLEGGKMERAANIISILCRPMILIPVVELSKETIAMINKNMKEDSKRIVEVIKKDMAMLEPYDEDTCLKRAEGFNDLPMDTVWEVFFCLQQQIILYKQNTTISSLEAARELLRQEQAADTIN